MFVCVSTYDFVWFVSWWVLTYIMMLISYWITNYYSFVTGKGCSSCFNRKWFDIFSVKEWFCQVCIQNGWFLISINMDNFNLGLLLLLYSLPFSYNLYCYLFPVFTHSLSLHIPLVLLLLSYSFHPSIITTVIHMMFR